MTWQTALLLCTVVAKTSTLLSALLLWEFGAWCLPGVERKRLKLSGGAACLSEEALAQVLQVAWLSGVSKPPGASVLSEPLLVFELIGKGTRHPLLPVHRCCSIAGSPAGAGRAKMGAQMV